MLKTVIVEDQEYLRQGLNAIISESGRNYKVIGTYSDGMEAMENIINEDVDVVITDICMPEMNGLQLIKALKEVKENTACIIISGYNDFEYARSALRLGVEDFLMKPIDQNELFYCLDRIYARKKEKPHYESGESRSSNRIIDMVKKVINEEYYNKLDLPAISDKVFLHPNYLSRLFKNETGMSITDYLLHVRIEKAKELLLNNIDLKVYDVAYMVGYSDSVFFNKMFKRIVGLTPKEYRNQSTNSKS